MSTTKIRLPGKEEYGAVCAMPVVLNSQDAKYFAAKQAQKNLVFHNAFVDKCR
jgi:hypothetical protein